MLMSIVSILDKLYGNAEKNVESQSQNCGEKIKLKVENFSVEHDLKNEITYPVTVFFFNLNISLEILRLEKFLA